MCLQWISDNFDFETRSVVNCKRNLMVLIFQQNLCVNKVKQYKTSAGFYYGRHCSFHVVYPNPIAFYSKRSP